MTLAAFDPTDFASSLEDARARFARYKSNDPFPGIAPALLNTADFLSYVAATGMIYPFTPDPEKPERVLKPASCAIPVAGEFLYWTAPDSTKPDRPKRVAGELKVGGDILLERNSIVYLSLAPTFQMPDYIAARYNLKIRHIYRGILVGTGPLVDPGFVGRLSIPLHNLTANDYEIRGEELLVWMEFTKLSPNERWTPSFSRDDPRTFYVPFPEVKNQRETVRDYVREAYDGPIRSSIPVLVEQAEKSATAAAEGAKQAAANATDLQQRFTQIGFGALVVIILAVGALIVGGYTVVQSAFNTDDSVRDSYQQLQQQVTHQQEQLSRQAGELRKLGAK